MTCDIYGYPVPEEKEALLKKTMYIIRVEGVEDVEMYIFADSETEAVRNFDRLVDAYLKGKN